MSAEYLRSELMIVRPDGRPTPEFVGLLNRIIDQMGGQGRDYVGETKTQSDGIVSGSVTGAFNDSSIGVLATAINAVNANVATAQATASAVAGGSTSTLGGSASPAFPVGTTSKQVTFTATGGTTPYTTYLWEYVSGSADITISSASVANPTFSSAQTNERSATWKVTVTDTAGDTFSVSVGITLLGSGSSA